MIHLARVRFVPIFVSLALLIAICGVSFLLIKSHIYQKIPHQLALSFTLTFVSTLILAVYFLLLRPNGLQTIFLNPTILFAMWLSLSSLPQDHNILFQTVQPIHYGLVGLSLVFIGFFFKNKKLVHNIEGWNVFVRVSRVINIVALVGLGSLLSSKDPVLTSLCVFAGLMSFLPLRKTDEK